MKHAINISCILLIILLMVSLDISAQSKKEAIGDKLMNQYSFAAATQAYKRALDGDIKNERIKLKLAECYRMLNDPENTAYWYGEVIQSKELQEPIDKYYYALALIGTGEVEEAQKWFDAYSKESPGDDRSLKYLEQLNNLDELFKDSSMYLLKKAVFNSSVSDFGPTYYKKGVVFVSARGEKSGTFNWNESAFLDLYYSPSNSLGIYSQPYPFNKSINTKYHEGPLSFFDNGKKVVVTRNNFEEGKLGKSSKGVTNLKLYFSSIDGEGEWSETVSFPFNSDEYSVGHPCINEEGTTLYFISDMPGGYGGTDLYVSHKTGNDWGEPRNLGSVLNTKGNEMFPFIHKNKTLYFASNGHGGLGGLDNYISDLSNPTVTNLGYPINSAKDDFGIIVNDDKTEGFISSNRDGLKGADDIYHFESLKPKIASIQVVVVDSIQLEPLPNVSIKMEIFGKETNDDYTTNENGEVIIPMEFNRQYKVLASKAEFRNGFKYVIPKKESEKILIKLKRECLAVKGIVQVKGEGHKSDSVLAVLTEKGALSRDTLWITGREDYEFCLEPVKKYNVRLSKEKFFGQSFDFNTNEGKPLYLATVVLEEIILNKAITLENIYYDVSRWEIRNDAAQELNTLVSLLEDNPSIEIELGSHTDSRGNDVYNLNLSKKRAHSAAEYIVSQGILSTRITSRGYGETNLINKCSDGVNCTSEEHQANRRTEFKVTKF